MMLLSAHAARSKRTLRVNLIFSESFVSQEDRGIKALTLYNSSGSGCNVMGKYGLCVEMSHPCVFN